MGTERDDELGIALRQLPVPEHQPDFWDELEHRLAGHPAVDELSERRTRRLGRQGIWMLSAAAAVALIVAAVAVLDKPPKTRVQITNPSTTTVPSTTPTSTPASEGPTTTTVTTAPVAVTGVEDFPGIYPAITLEQLERAAQDSKDGGPGQKLDRDSVVRQYLTDHGISNPTLDANESGGLAFVRYATGTGSGTVRLKRFLDGAYVVTSATTDVVQSVKFERTGDRIDVTVELGAGGRVSAKAGPLGSEFSANASARATPGTPSELRLSYPQRTEPALLRVEVDAGDAGRGFAEARIATEAPAATAPALTKASTLAADRLGPVVIGMSFAAARRAAAAPMTEGLDTYCDPLVADGLPGVSFVRTVPDSTISLIFVDQKEIRTAAGAGIGSTADEVIRSHGTPSRRSSGESSPQWLIYDGPQGEAGPGLRFTLVDGRVVSMTAGIGVGADELCA